MVRFLIDFLLKKYFVFDYLKKDLARASGIFSTFLYLRFLEAKSPTLASRNLRYRKVLKMPDALATHYLLRKFVMEEWLDDYKIPYFYKVDSLEVKHYGRL